MSMVVCFGEILMRMSPSADWLEAHSLPVYPGGSELNVATALGRWNLPVKYITAMPDHYLSAQLGGYMKKRGIDISEIYKGGNRIGLYFLQQGTDLKNSGVIYDRANSSFSELEPGQIDWAEVFRDASWFHFSAISPAVSATAAAVCLEALEMASKKNITISVDLNYRSKLWQYGKAPEEVMPSLVKYCSIVMGNIWAAHTMLGTTLPSGIHDNPSMNSYLSHATRTAMDIQAMFPACAVVANSFRFDDGMGIRYFSSLYSGNKNYHSPEFFEEHIADRSGSGDCFMAALIYGIQRSYHLQDTINFASAAAVGKLKETGDATGNTVEDIQEILKRHG